MFLSPRKHVHPRTSPAPAPHMHPRPRVRTPHARATPHPVAPANAGVPLFAVIPSEREGPAVPVVSRARTPAHLTHTRARTTHARTPARTNAHAPRTRNAPHRRAGERRGPALRCHPERTRGTCCSTRRRNGQAWEAVCMAQRNSDTTRHSPSASRKRQNSQPFVGRPVIAVAAELNEVYACPS